MTEQPDTEPLDYFDSAYRSYEGQNPRRKLDHYLRMIEARCEVDQPRLLDVGCGRGLFLSHVATGHPDWDISGADTEHSAIEATRSLVPHATLRPGTAEALPFPDSVFDVVTAWDVLEHVPDLELGIAEIQRCLKPGGLVALVVPVYDGPAGPIVRILDKDPTHLHKLGRESWLDRMAEHFRDIEWHGILRYLVTEGFYLHVPTKRLRRLTPAVFVSARSQ